MSRGDWANRGIAAIGMSTIETYLIVGEIPLREGKHLGQKYGPYSGGMATNVAANLSLLGLKVTLVSSGGCPGETPDSSALYDASFSSHYSPGAHAAQVIICVESVHGKRAAVLLDHQRPKALTPNQSLAIRQAGLIYYDGSWPEIIPEVLSTISHTSAFLFVNCEFFRSEDSPLIKRSQVIMANESYWFSGRTVSRMDVENRILNHWNVHKKWIGISFGKRGAVLYDGQAFEHCPAVGAVVVDTTGAGDAFAAGLIYALAQNMERSNALRLSSILGAMQCEHVGPNLLMSKKSREYVFQKIETSSHPCAKLSNSI